eukprot:CAMPEP_0194208246 /NCGR_PEP_ID=MMETSP0156-20130528/6751_1 /TAXON_ID=33649 /ORGANISM="Thalassionema nitzschioides, Strain L26-B" /LENGTH=295 /DNA_ID=CAMNT_0038935175 /DNA_START=13 /DNA_END=900 /DNA_ORIENTATION=-
MLSQDKAKEELIFMLQQETSSYSIEMNYLYDAVRSNGGGTVKKGMLTETFRRRVCGWIFEVVDYFQYDYEIAAIAIYYLDQVTSIQTNRRGKPVMQLEYQLTGVTSLYLAIKLYRTNGESRPDIQAFTSLSQGHFSLEDIERTELEMLRLMNWRVNPPTSVHIGVSLLKLVSECWKQNESSEYENSLPKIFEVSRYFTKLSFNVPGISLNYKASEIAFASVLCAIEILKDRISLPDWIQSEFITTVIESTNLTLESGTTLCGLLLHLAPSTNEFDTISGNTSPGTVARDIYDNIQ